MRIFASFIAVFGFAFFGKISAQNIDSVQVKDLNLVVVTASRSEKPAFTSPEKITVVTAKQIEKQQSRTAPEALQKTNGVWLQKTNHGGGSPFLRGLTGNQTLQIVDGIRLNNATFRYGPNQYLNTIDLFSIEKMEVFFGGGSTQFGSDAFGGTIAIFSKMPDFSEKLKASGQVFGRAVSQNMEKTGRAEAEISTKKMAIAAGFSLRNFGDLVGGKNTGKQIPTGYDERAFDVRGRFFVSKNWEITAAHRDLRQRNVPVFHKIQLENFSKNEFEPQVKNISWLKNEWKTAGKLEKTALTVAHQFSEEGRASQKNGSSILRLENDKVETVSAILQSEFQFFEKGKTVGGAEIYHDKIRSTRRDTDVSTQISSEKRGLYPDNSTMTSAAVFVLQDFQIEKWTFSGGLRWNTFLIKVAEKDLGGAVELKPSAIVGSAGALRKLGKNGAAFVNFNSGFRAPNVDDLGTLGIVDFRFEVPNYDLRPEKSYNSEIGYRLKTNKLQFETVFFRNELRDLVARVRQGQDSMQGYPIYLKINSEKGYIQGLESELRWQFSPILSAEISAAWAFGQNISRAEPMRRIPPVNGRFALNFEKKKWFATAEILAADAQKRLAQGDRDDNRIGADGTAGWAVLNFSGGFSAKHFSVFLDFQNLTNRDYRYHGSGVNGVGRSAGLVFSLKF